MSQLSKIVKQIEEDMHKVPGVNNIKIHVQDFNNTYEKSYIEFKAQSKDYEKSAEKLYLKYSKMIRANTPELSISYSNPHFQHQNNLLRRIEIEVNHGTKDPAKKRELLIQAAQNFHYIVKRWIEYPEAKKKKKNR